MARSVRVTKKPCRGKPCPMVKALSSSILSPYYVFCLFICFGFLRQEYCVFIFVINFQFVLYQFCLLVFICVPSVCGAWGDQKIASAPLGLELQNSGNLTLFPKSSQCSHLPVVHLSSPSSTHGLQLPFIFSLTLWIRRATDSQQPSCLNLVSSAITGCAPS